MLSNIFSGTKDLEQWTLFMLPCELEFIHLLFYGKLFGTLIHYPVDALAQLSLIDTILCGSHRILSLPSDLPLRSHTVVHEVGVLKLCPQL